MAKVHFLNVKQGDCSMIQHNSGRVSLLDVCCGNLTLQETTIASLMKSLSHPKGNYRMCQSPTEPISYLKSLQIREIWRFILTHPDMDHMDGFGNLIKNLTLHNFWDSGARKGKPDFEGSPYNEDDWDTYVKVRDSKAGTNSLLKQAGAKFKYANKLDEQGGSHDGLYIVAPSNGLIDDANESEDFNDASYVIVYWTGEQRIIIAGDAHDGSWEYAIKNHCDLLKNCSVLMAPHHGRSSDANFEFLDTLNPKFTLLGCAPSEDLAYDAWRNRDLFYLTKNQTGNVVIETTDKSLDIYIENQRYAEDSGCDTTITNSQGYYYVGTI
jgi:beta-lactamase superfamily II metal-dependent hydrolase